MEFIKRLFSLMAAILTSPLTGGRRLKYGNETINEAMVSLTMDNAVQLYALSSYFVSINSSGNGILTTSSQSNIFGFLLAGQGDLSGSAGTTSWACNVALDAIYRIPVVSGTYVRATYRGTKCAINVVSNIQGAAVATASPAHVCILDGDETNNYWVIVRISPILIGAAQN